MSQFLKLTNFIINKNYIHSIAIKPNKYCIQLVSNKFDGTNFIFAGFGIGNIYSHNYEIEVCEFKDSSDYKIVSDLIDKP
jgi:hypothetical protein